MVLAAVIAAIPVSIRSSRADAFARAGSQSWREGRWPEAVAAYGEAVRLQPRQDAYLTALGRALIQQAASLEPALRDARLQQARTVREAAERLNPQDPHAPRNLASVDPVRARTSDSATHERLLEETDRSYARAIVLSSGLPAL